MRLILHLPRLALNCGLHEHRMQAALQHHLQPRPCRAARRKLLLELHYLHPLKGYITARMDWSCGLWDRDRMRDQGWKAYVFRRNEI